MRPFWLPSTLALGLALAGCSSSSSPDAATGAGAAGGTTGGTGGTTSGAGGAGGGASGQAGAEGCPAGEVPACACPGGDGKQNVCACPGPPVMKEPGALVCATPGTLMSCASLCGGAGAGGQSAGGAGGSSAGGEQGRAGQSGAAGSKPMVCVPGASVACTGPAGCKGGQVCAADGSALGPCDCGTGGAGGSEGMCPSSPPMTGDACPTALSHTVCGMCLCKPSSGDLGSTQWYCAGGQGGSSGAGQGGTTAGAAGQGGGTGGSSAGSGGAGGSAGSGGAFEPMFGTDFQDCNDVTAANKGCPATSPFPRCIGWYTAQPTAQQMDTWATAHCKAVTTQGNGSTACCPP